MVQTNIMEWKMYYIDHEDLNKSFGGMDHGNRQRFVELLHAEFHKAATFSHKREEWCKQQASNLEERIVQLEWVVGGNNASEIVVVQYLKLKKSIVELAKELELVFQFVECQRKCVLEMMKKISSLERSSQLFPAIKTINPNQFSPKRILILQKAVERLFLKLDQYKPEPNDSWRDRKVYSVGCFDLFHRGHINILQSLRDFGNFVVVGIHDDQSYYNLKKKHPIHPLELRMKNVKQYVDQVFVIPSTMPTSYVLSMISNADIQNDKCCYVRGDDMPNFPGREQIQEIMPIYLMPRSQGVSSTLVRSLYHSGEQIAQKAAFASTDASGKPIIKE